MPHKPETIPSMLYVVPTIPERAIITRALHEAAERQSDPKIAREMRDVGTSVFGPEWHELTMTMTIKKAIDRGWKYPASGDVLAAVASAEQFVRDNPSYDLSDSDLPF